MAALAGGNVGCVEGQGIAIGELGALPFVVGSECANPLIVVQCWRQICLVASGAEFRCVVNILHDGFGVPVKVRKNFRVRHNTRDTVAVFIDHDRRHSHYEAAVAERGVDALDGMAGCAGEPVTVKRAIHGCPLSSAPASTAMDCGSYRNDA